LSLNETEAAGIVGGIVGGLLAGLGGIEFLVYEDFVRQYR